MMKRLTECRKKKKTEKRSGLYSGIVCYGVPEFVMLMPVWPDNVPKFLMKLLDEKERGGEISLRLASPSSPTVWDGGYLIIITSRPAHHSTGRWRFGYYIKLLIVPSSLFFSTFTNTHTHQTGLLFVFSSWLLGLFNYSAHHGRQTTSHL